MSVVNHNHRYIFMHEPHTGGRSIENALMEQHEGSQNFNGDHHISAVQMIDNEWVTKEQFDTYFKFRIIRSPYDWLVTCWMRNAKDAVFSKWIFNIGLGFTTNGTLFWRYQDQVNYNVRFELLDENLEYILKIYNIPPVTLKHIGRTENKPDWHTLLTVSQAKQLEEFYPDINAFGYSIFKG